jgi:NitT/TauT family transport system substrate-binding protein
MRRIHRVICSLFVVLPVAAVASCSAASGSSVSSGPPPEQSTITLDVVPTADAAGIYIAEKDGFFAQQGLTVKINTINGGEVGMADLQDGHAQLVEGNYVSFILAQIAKSYDGKPINMAMIADTSQMQPGNQALYVMPDSKFKTVADLAEYHATVGINTIKNIAQVFLGSLFEANGLNLKSINQVEDQLPNLAADLADHKVIGGHAVDAVWLPEPFGTIAEMSFGAVQLADFDTGALENFPIGTIVGNPTWIKSHPNTVGAFLRAFQEGQQVADTNRAAVEQALEKNSATTGATPEIAAIMTLDTYPLVMDVPTMQRVSDAMFQFGLEPGLKQPYNVTDMIYPEPGEIGG